MRSNLITLMLCNLKNRIYIGSTPSSTNLYLVFCKTLSVFRRNNIKNAKVDRNLYVNLKWYMLLQNLKIFGNYFSF